jgi:hypothetical protein
MEHLALVLNRDLDNREVVESADYLMNHAARYNDKKWVTLEVANAGVAQRVIDLIRTSPPFLTVAQVKTFIKEASPLKTYLCVRGTQRLDDQWEPVGYGDGHELIIVAKDEIEVCAAIDQHYIDIHLWNPDVDDAPDEVPSWSYYIKEIDTTAPTIIRTTGTGFFNWKEEKPWVHNR